MPISSVYVVRINDLPIGHFDANTTCDMAVLKGPLGLTPSERDNLSEIETALRADLSKASRRN